MNKVKVIDPMMEDDKFSPIQFPHLEIIKHKKKNKKGTLSVSRAIGDFSFKKEQSGATNDMITCSPQIRVLNLDYINDEFMIIACDGLFDILSGQECVDFVRAQLLKSPVGEQDPQKIAKGNHINLWRGFFNFFSPPYFVFEELCHHAVEKCLSFKKQCDNVSAIIILFTRGTVEELTESQLSKVSVSPNSPDFCGLSLSIKRTESQKR